MSVSLTTVAACQVAGINRDRFNEFVAIGDYRGAPPTVAGRARVFSADDILGLVIFRDLMAGGMTAWAAGRISYAVVEVAKENPSASLVSYVHPWRASPGESVDGAARPFQHMQSVDSVDEKTPDVLVLVIFNVGVLREVVAKRCQNIVGCNQEAA